MTSFIGILSKTIDKYSHVMFIPIYSAKIYRQQSYFQVREALKLKIVLHSSNGNLNQPLKEKFSSKFYCIKQEGCSHKERLLSGVSAFGINYCFKGFLILGWEVFKVQFILKRSYYQGSLHCFADFFFLFSHLVFFLFFFLFSCSSFFLASLVFSFYVFL